jgi:hypothetical protein
MVPRVDGTDMRAILIAALLAGGPSVTGQGNTVNGSGSAPGTQGAAPTTGRVVQVPQAVGPGTYCLVTEVVSPQATFPPYNGLSDETQVPCPGSAPSPDQLAHAWAQSATLPGPTLTIAPGYAITGLPAYMQIETIPWSTTLGQIVHVECGHDYFDVDWGDGAQTTTTTTGGPWPTGTVTHVYQVTDPGLTVTVTERWSCSWTAPGYSGQITGMVSKGQLRDFAVRQIQESL